MKSKSSSYKFTILTALMCGRIPINCNSILFTVNSHELIKRTYYFNGVLYCAVAFRFIADELCAMCNSHEHWMNNFNFTENKQTKNIRLFIECYKIHQIIMILQLIHFYEEFTNYVK